MANGKRTPPPSGRRIAQLLSHVRPAAAEQSVVDRLDGAAEPDDSLYDASVAALAVQDQLPVVVLDLLLPRQRVQLAVQDVAHTRMVCGCLESAAGGGAPACFGVVGRDPLSQQPLSFGVECEILHSELAGGTMQIELVGRRCFSVQGATRQSDGHSVASVGWAFAEPPEPAELAPLRASTEQLYALTEEWLSLVLATGAEQHPGHMGACAAPILRLRVPASSLNPLTLSCARRPGCLLRTQTRYC